MRRTPTLGRTLFLCLLFGLLPLALQAQSVENKDSGKSFSTIQAAIDDSDTDAGDLIEVGSSTYSISSSITVDKQVTLQGTSGAEVEVTDASINAAAFSVEASGATINGLTIYSTHSRFNDPLASRDWNGIDVRGVDVSAANVTVTNNTIYDVRDGILVASGSQDLTVTNNTIDNTKGSILLRVATDPATSGYTITGNDVDSEGNEWDIVFLESTAASGTAPVNRQQLLVALAADNNGMKVLDREYAAANRTYVYADPSSTAGPGDDFDLGNGLGNIRQPLASVQEAVNAATSRGTVFMKDGTYNESYDGTRSVFVQKDNLTITGESQNGVEIIPASASRGIQISADGVTLENATIDASNISTYGIKAQGENPALDATEDRADGLTLRNLTVQGSGSSEVDLNGVDNAVLEDLTLNGQNTGGNALAVTDGNNVTISDISTDGNNEWGGIALYAGGGDFTTQGINNVAITGNAPSEDRSIYKQVKNGFDVTDLELPPAFQHTLRNSTFRQPTYSDSDQFTLYVTDRATAVSAALGLNNPSDSYVQTLARDGNDHVSRENYFIVGTTGGDAMSIQTAADAADPGAVVTVDDGIYAQNVEIEKPLTLTGTGGGGPSTDAKATTASCSAGTVIDASGSTTGVTITSGASGGTLSNLCIKGAQEDNIYTDASISGYTLNGLESLNATERGFEIDQNGDISNLSITGSTFSGNDQGFYIRGTVDGLDISDSHFDGNNYGFYTSLGGSSGEEIPHDGTNVSDVLVINSSFNSNPFKGVYAEKMKNATFDNIEAIDSGTDPNFQFESQSIQFNLKLQEYGSITVKNSTIKGSIGEGINVIARYMGWGGDYDQYPASLNSFTVENNVVENNRWGVVVGQNVLSTTIKHNLINNNGNDVNSYEDRSDLSSNRGGVLFYANPDDRNYQVSNNCITENGLATLDGNTGYGLETTTSPLTLDNNWWGSAGGPGHDGANILVGPTTTSNFATDPVSGVEGCGAPSDECDASDFDPVVVQNTPPGKVQLTVSDPEGISKVNFYLLDNFTVVSDDGNFEDSGDDVWTPTSSGTTSGVFILTQADTDNPDASYFAKITNECGTVTDIDPPMNFELRAPEKLTLTDNYPNPFHRQTTIGFSLPEPMDVTVSVYDIMGRKVTTLQQGAMSAGTHELQWNGRGEGGTHLASGTYLVRLHAGEQTRTTRVDIVR